MKYLLFFFIFQSISYAAEQVIVYELEGTVRVVYPINDINSVIVKDVPKGVPYKIIDKKDIPNRRFRNAWMLTDKVTVNIVKAREIRKKEILNLRDKKLLELRGKLEDAQDLGNMAAQNQIRLKRVELRRLDETLNLDSVPLEELGDYLPEVLK